MPSHFVVNAPANTKSWVVAVKERKILSSLCSVGYANMKATSLTGAYVHVHYG